MILIFEMIKKIYKGYWTFNLIKRELGSYSSSVTLLSNKHDCSCTLTSDKVINLKDFEPIIWFPKIKNIPMNTVTRSDEVDVN